jgi:ComF family protein
MGIYLGTLLQKSTRMNDFDVLIPMPIHASREKKRGYNQAQVLCEGIETATGIPHDKDAIARIKATATQTHKSRISRWQNVQSGFMVQEAAAIQNKRILLVDDVVTTGATLEACGEIILRANPASLNIAALAWASD